MSYVTTDEIIQARQMDLLTYLQNYEPENLIKVSRDTYCTKEHDSLKINNGMWHWFSRGFGGATALDYLIKVKEMTFPQAVMTILGKTAVSKPVFMKREADKERRLLLPERSSSTDHVVRYLRGRGIHPSVINYCLKNDLLYESADKHRNAVFLCRDINGKVRSAAVRSTTTAYKGDVTGSDKHCSFSFPGDPGRNDLHIFESAIDLLSYASILQMKGYDWQEVPMLSLAGVYIQSRKDVVPVALAQYLKDHPVITDVHMHLDNDEVGRGASDGIKAGLQNRGYTVFDEPPACGKDVNDQLMANVGLKRNREVYQR